MEKTRTTPTWEDYGLSLFACFCLLWLLVTSGLLDNDAYGQYNSNFGIRSLHLLAFAGNVAILGSLVGWWLHSARQNTFQCLLVLCALLGAILPWLELWYGSKFYYGEVRDKQGLPWSVVNFGPVGTTIYLAYLISMSKIPFINGTAQTTVRSALIGAVIVAQSVLLGVLIDDWKLWRS